MKKILKKIFLGLLTILIIGFIAFHLYYMVLSRTNKSKLIGPATVIHVDGFEFRDLNKNNELDIYEDRRAGVEERIDDLISQMTLEEKAGMMFINMIVTGKNGDLLEKPTFSNPFSFMMPTNSTMVAKKGMNHFNILDSPDARHMARWNNEIQKLAEKTRLGIPVTIASDPRHSFSNNVGANLNAGSFSKWCQPLGLAAIGDSALTREFGDIARQEYIATGIRLALHPMADLATEPRWARINGTFGEDAELSRDMTRAYVLGSQGDSLHSASVACMTKHFSGGGPQKDGWDAHFKYGADQAYPGNNFDHHLIPFEGAFEANTAQIMPYYGIPVGQTSEDVGFAFNKEVISDLLRDTFNFQGVVCTDWGVLTDKKIMGRVFFESTGWGVAHLSPEDKIVKALEAGIDQFGGEQIPEMLAKVVREGKVDESRIDESIRRLLRDKFTMGLFDDPYVDPEEAERVVGNDEYVQKGKEAQRKSTVLLKNSQIAGQNALPLSREVNLYVEGMDEEIADQYGNIVKTPSEADFAILRVATPHEVPPGSQNFLERMFHQGDLDFKDEALSHILGICSEVPTIVDIYMDRPAVIPEIEEQAAAVLANFGAEDDAIMDIVFGRFNPSGKLPFDLPSSMESVEKQYEDVPFDAENPLFRFGHGLSYDILENRGQ